LNRFVVIGLLAPVTRGSLGQPRRPPCRRAAIPL